jgi:L-methionine (R)-S-oxide reductase
MDPALQALELLLDTAVDRPAKARALAEVIRRSRGYRWVGLYDVTPTEIVAVGWTGPQPPRFPRFSVDKGLSGEAVRMRAPVIVQDVTNDARWLETFSTTRAEAIFPVSASPSGQILGTIDAESDRPGVFGREDTAFLATVATLLRPFWG